MQRGDAIEEDMFRNVNVECERSQMSCGRNDSLSLPRRLDDLKNTRVHGPLSYPKSNMRALPA